MKTKILITLTMLFILFPGIKAQDLKTGFGLELNAGCSFAAKEIDNARLGLGYGYEGILHYDFMPLLGIYGGWGWNKFAASPEAAADNYEETGYIFGLSFRIPTGNPEISYYIRAGGLYNHIETEDSEGRIINDTGHGLGFQLAGGINISLNDRWSFTPGIKFNSLSHDVEYEDGSKKTYYQYVSARIGFTRIF